MKAVSVTATGGAITVMVTGPVTGRVTRRCKVAPEGATSVLSAFSYIFRKIVPCNTRVLITVSTIGRLNNRVSTFRVVPGLFCPVLLLFDSLVAVVENSSHAKTWGVPPTKDCVFFGFFRGVLSLPPYKDDVGRTRAKR